MEDKHLQSFLPFLRLPWGRNSHPSTPFLLLCVAQCRSLPVPSAYPGARHSLRQDMQVFSLEKRGGWEGCLVKPKEGGDGRAWFYEGKRAFPPRHPQTAQPTTAGGYGPVG